MFESNFLLFFVDSRLNFELPPFVNDVVKCVKQVIKLFNENFECLLKSNFHLRQLFKRQPRFI